MKTQKLIRIAGLIGLTLLALGAMGYAVGGREKSTGSAAVEDVAFDARDDVVASIDKALGRGTAVQPQPQPAIGAVPPVSADKGAPVQRSAANEATASVAPSGGAGSTADPLTSTADRKIVQTASLRLQVKEVGGSFEEVGRIATGAGGFVASSSFAFQGEQQVASMTIRVPATRYQDVLREVRALGAKVDSETSNASDVTEEYSDLTARLRNLEATEGQLLQLLGQARNINEVLQVQDRLNSVRAEIERVKGRMALLDKLSDLATITVHLRPVVAVAKADTGGVDLGAKVSEAWQSSLDFLGGIAAGVLTVVVFAWWLPFLALPAYVAGSRWLRSRPQPVSAGD